MPYYPPATSGSGDVVGPSSATDLHAARFDSTTGKLIKDSPLKIYDSGLLQTDASVAGASTLGFWATNRTDGLGGDAMDFRAAGDTNSTGVGGSVYFNGGAGGASGTGGSVYFKAGAAGTDGTYQFLNPGTAFYCKMDISSLTATRTITIPDTTGTVALTADIPTALTDLDTTVTGSQLNTLYSNTSGTNTGDQTTVSGNAGTATALETARTIGTLTGDVTSAGSSFDGTANNTNSTTVTKINGTSLAGLATGILKNTTTTGVPSIAVAGDFPTLNQNTTGSAASLTTARTFRTNLASTSTASFDGTANVTPGVTGTLPVSNGGTGASTHTSGNYLKGNGTGAITSESAATLAATVGNLLFPVGALYTATVSTNPGTLLGFGTWAAYGEGRVLVGKAAAGTFATAGATGGEETHTLTAAESGLPAHTHTATQAAHRHSNGNHGTSGSYGHLDSAGASSSGTFYTDYQTPAITVNNNTAASASSAHNNLQPYIVVYIWQRTA